MRKIISELTGEEATFHYEPDHFLLVKKAGDLIRMLNATIGCGTNFNGYDLSKLSNPYRKRRLNEREYLDKKVIEFMREDQDLFKINPDNSPVKYKSQTWRESIVGMFINFDFLDLMKSNYSPYTTDQKLETVGRMLDHKANLGLGFGKTVGSYKEMEDRWEAGKGSKMAMYVLTDTEAHRIIGKYLLPMLHQYSKILHVSLEDMLKGKMPLATFINDKKHFLYGIRRNIFDNFSSRSLNNNKTKKRILKKYLPNSTRGEHKNIYMYFNPIFINKGLSIIKNNEALTQIQNDLYSETDSIKKLFKYNVLDHIVASTYVDKENVRFLNTDRELYEMIFNVKFKQIEIELDSIAEEVATTILENEPVAWDGNFCFVKNRSSKLEEKGFIPISKVDVIVKNSNSFIVKYLNDEGKHITGTINLKIPSYKQRYSEDYIMKGAAANFQKNIMFDIVEIDSTWQKRVRRAGILSKDIVEGNLPIEDYFMSIRPGHKLNNYSSTFFNRQLGKIILNQGLEKHKNYTILFEKKPDSYNQEALTITHVDKDYKNKEFNLNKRFYLEYLWEDKKGFSSLFYPLVVSEFPKENWKKVLGVLYQEVETGNFGEETISKLENLMIKEDFFDLLKN